MDQKDEAIRLLQEVLEDAPSPEEKRNADQLLYKIGVWFMQSRVALGIEYDGSEYNGFQKQKITEQTIQGNLENSISKVANHSIKTFCSGRTDAGVHAFMQVVHFDTDSKFVVSFLKTVFCIRFFDTYQKSRN